MSTLQLAVWREPYQADLLLVLQGGIYEAPHLQGNYQIYMQKPIQLE